MKPATPKSRVKVSAPFAHLLCLAGLSPKKVHGSIERLEKLSRPLNLHVSHPYLRAVRRSTGVMIMRVERRNRHMLMRIEDFGSSPAWKYYEFSRNNCILEIRAEVPETVKLVAACRQLKCLVDLHPAFSDIFIHSISDHRGWLQIRVEDSWQSF